STAKISGGVVAARSNKRISIVHSALENCVEGFKRCAGRELGNVVAVVAQIGSLAQIPTIAIAKGFHLGDVLRRVVPCQFCFGYRLPGMVTSLSTIPLATRSSRILSLLSRVSKRPSANKKRHSVG